MDNRHTNLQYFAGIAQGTTIEDETNDLENSYSDIPQERYENTEEEQQRPYADYMDKNVIYPTIDTIDRDGNEIRDARNFVFNSRVLSTANRIISSSGIYNHYE